MGAIRRFEEIQAWQLARRLANEVYRLTKKSAFAKDYALKDQIQRASGSAMHNIAEGFDAGSNKEFVRFLKYARRSATEVQSQLYLAIDEAYITQTEFNEAYDLAKQCKHTINGFIRYLETTNR